MIKDINRCSDWKTAPKCWNCSNPNLYESYTRQNQRRTKKDCVSIRCSRKAVRGTIGRKDWWLQTHAVVPNYITEPCQLCTYPWSSSSPVRHWLSQKDTKNDFWDLRPFWHVIRQKDHTFPIFLHASLSSVPCKGNSVMCKNDYRYGLVRTVVGLLLLHGSLTLSWGSCKRKLRRWWHCPRHCPTQNL